MDRGDKDRDGERRRGLVLKARARPAKRDAAFERREHLNCENPQKPGNLHDGGIACARPPLLSVTVVLLSSEEDKAASTQASLCLCAPPLGPLLV